VGVDRTSSLHNDPSGVLSQYPTNFFIPCITVSRKSCHSTSWTRHLYVLAMATSHVCPICGNNLSTASSLKRHVITRHPMYEYSRQGQRVHDALAIDVSMVASLPSGSDDITEKVFREVLWTKNSVMLKWVSLFLETFPCLYWTKLQ